MAKSTTMTVRLDEETKTQLGKLAEITDRSRSYLAAHAIRLYVDMNSWQIEGIKKAVDEADSGRAKFVEHEAVTAWLDSWGTHDEMEPPS